MGAVVGDRIRVRAKEVQIITPQQVLKGIFKYLIFDKDLLDEIRTYFRRHTCTLAAKSGSPK